MPWPWRRRKSAATPSAARHAMPRQASWAQPAFPPAPVPEAPAGPVAVPVTVPVTGGVAVPVQGPAVRLGFVDGTEVALDERDPSAMALRAVAELLVQESPD